MRCVIDSDFIPIRMKRPNSSQGTLNDLLKPHMEGMTLSEAVEEERLYMVDYTEMLQNLPCKTGLVRIAYYFQTSGVLFCF